MKVLARYEAPKQRMTRRYGYILVEQRATPHEDPSRRFCVHRLDLDDNLPISSAYNLTVEAAWQAFHDGIRDNSQYGPSTWEEPTI